MMMMAAIVMVMVTSMVVYCAHSPSGFGNGQAGDIYGFTMLCVLLLSVCVFDEMYYDDTVSNKESKDQSKVQHNLIRL